MTNEDKEAEAKKYVQKITYDVLLQDGGYFASSKVIEAYLAGAEAAAPKWIKCSDMQPGVESWYLTHNYKWPKHNYKWPKADAEVRCYYLRNDDHFGYYLRNDDHFAWSGSFQSPTHWMPLPVAPEEKEEGK